MRGTVWVTSHGNWLCKQRGGGDLERQTGCSPAPQGLGAGAVDGCGLFRAGAVLSKKHRPPLPKVQNPGQTHLIGSAKPEEGGASGWTLPSLMAEGCFPKPNQGAATRGRICPVDSEDPGKCHSHCHLMSGPRRQPLVYCLHSIYSLNCSQWGFKHTNAALLLPG